MSITQTKADKTGHGGYTMEAANGEKFTQMGGILRSTGAGIPSTNISSEFGFGSGRGLHWNVSDQKHYAYYGGTTWSAI